MGMGMMGRRAGALTMVALFGALWPIPLRAQDVLQIAPEAYKKIADSNRARVLEVSFKPGAKIAAHSHPEHLLYFLTDATLVMKRDGRTPYEMSFTAGQALMLPAQSGAIENVGDKAVRALIVEFKPPPKAAARPGRVKRPRKPRR